MVAKHIASGQKIAALRIHPKITPCPHPLMSSYGKLWQSLGASFSSWGVSRGFQAGLQAFKSKFMFNRLETVDRLILTPA